MNQPTPVRLNPPEAQARFKPRLHDSLSIASK